MEQTHLIVLEYLAKHGQQMVLTQDVNIGLNEADLAACLNYLQGHGMVTCGVIPVFSATRLPISAQITVKGIDYWREDGGLTAELSVITVKLHQDTLTALIAARVGQSDLADTEKSRLLKNLKALSKTGAEHLVKKWVDYACENSPTLIPWLQTVLVNSTAG